MTDLPSGFEPLPPYGGFGAAIGPIHWKACGPREVIAGLRVDVQHCGSLPFLHGGMLSALIDTAFIWTVRRLYEPGYGLVTTQLSVDFIAGARPGDWIEAHVQVLSTGRRLAFVSCLVSRGEALVARGSGQFQVIDRAERPLPHA